MIRQFVLAVVATAAVSVRTTNATAQASVSQIHALRSESDEDADATSEYTMLYWARVLGAFGAGSYATISHYSKATESISMVGDPTDLIWARLMRGAPTASINSADDPSLPENAEFFNPPTLTDEHADAPPSYYAGFPSLFTSDSDEAPPMTNAAVSLFVSPSLAGPDAWTSSDAGSDDQSIPDTDKLSDSVLAPMIDAPNFAVVASPEPGTLVLFGTGFVGIAGIAIKRKRAVA